jgi:hypothetical protein
VGVPEVSTHVATFFRLEMENLLRGNITSNACSVELIKLGGAEVSHLGSRETLKLFVCLPFPPTFGEGQLKREQEAGKCWDSRPSVAVGLVESRIARDSGLILERQNGKKQSNRV